MNSQEIQNVKAEFENILKMLIYEHAQWEVGLYEDSLKELTEFFSNLVFSRNLLPLERSPASDINCEAYKQEISTALASEISTDLIQLSLLETPQQCETLCAEIADLWLIQTEEEDAQEEDDEGLSNSECEICFRTMPLTFHHLHPRAIHKRYLKKYPQVNAFYLHTTGAKLCAPCHRAVHRTIPNHMELAEKYNTVDKLMELEKMQKWAEWASKQRSRNPTTRGLRHHR